MWPFANATTVIGLLVNIGGVIVDLPGRIVDLAIDRDDAILRYDFTERQISAANDLARDRFPEDFRFGVVASAYPTEGAWNVSDKTESDWDHVTHNHPDLIVDGSNADIAADSYDRYEEDVGLAYDIGSKVYRLSVSWSRLLPYGFENHVSPDGLWYYMNVVDDICRNGMEPLIVLFEKEMPYVFMQFGGFTNPLITDAFVNYAKILFGSFGDQVKYWITFNDPNTLCRSSYGGKEIPGFNQSGIADYLCAHNILLTHTRIYEMYRKRFYPWQKGKIGISVNFTWWEPMDARSSSDYQAAERAYQWYNNWFVNPIFGKNGDYPDIMKQRIDFRSFLQDFPYSRLPMFTYKELKRVKGSADFLGVNYYTTSVASNIEDNVSEISFENDAGIRTNVSKYPGDNWVKNTPWALGRLLRRLSDEHEVPEIFITANGYTDNGGVVDAGRAVYHCQHMHEVLKAIKQGLNIRGYLVASLIDGFEWSFGYEKRRGLFHVDFSDPELPRTPKLSANLVADVFLTGRVRVLGPALNETTVGDSPKTPRRNRPDK